MRRFRILGSKAAGRSVLAFLGVAALLAAPRPSDALTITPTFTAAFNSSFGVNAIAAQNAWIAAANVFQTNFSDNIHINITVDAVPGTGVFGQSNTPLGSLSFAILRSFVVADAKLLTTLRRLGLPAPSPRLTQSAERTPGGSPRRRRRRSG